MIETSFLSGLGNALWQFNTHQAEVLLEGIKAQPDILFVQLRAVSGENIMLEEESRENVMSRDFPLLHCSAFDEDLKVGDLHVTLSLAQAQDRLWNQLATFLMYLIFQWTVARHLQQISRYIEKTDFSSSTKDLVLERSEKFHGDEIDKIAVSLNFTPASLQAQQKQTNLMRNRLEAVLNTASSGVISLDPSGNIIQINPQARQMLARLSEQPPFAWPEAATFLDPEGMQPLETPKNPIQRALVGQRLRGEVAIMDRANGSVPRYGRISSAAVETNEQDELHTVLVMDDMSEQEKNHQQAGCAGAVDRRHCHDFNNLLGTIQYAAQLALDGQDDPTISAYLNTALNSVQRGANLTRQQSSPAACDRS